MSIWFIDLENKPPKIEVEPLAGGKESFKTNVAGNLIPFSPEANFGFKWPIQIAPSTVALQIA